MQRPQKTTPLLVPADALLTDVRQLIQTARARIARAVDSGMVMVHWEVGNRIHREILKEKRAQYGAQIVSALGRELECEFGRGFSEKSLRHMIRFAEAFPDKEIVSALRRQLSWTHFKALIYLEDPLKRKFYAQISRLEKWNTRTLTQKIQSMLYERTAISKKPDKLIKQELKELDENGKITPDLVFRDPYFLDFLGLKDTYAEKDLEAAILREMEAFLLELGVGFAFMERQKRITLDGVDFHLDLIFFHRPLKRLVAIDLKIGDFQPADMGQMELYLRWLDRHERQKGEEKPVGMILCAGKKHETVEYLDLGGKGIHVAQYLAKLPPREMLEKELHQAIVRARARLRRTKGRAAIEKLASAMLPKGKQERK